MSLRFINFSVPRALSLVAFMALWGCDVEPVPTPEVQAPGLSEEDIWDVVDRWEDFEAYGDELQPSNSGSPIFFEIYLSEGAASWLENPDSGTDEGIAIVRPTYDSEDSASLASLTMMLKVPGSSPETDDWNWAKVSSDGSEVEFGSDTNASCSGCHAVVRDTNHWLLEVDVND